MSKDVWEKWPESVHESEDAKKRIESAQKGNLTPVKIFNDECMAYFQGSQKYETFLDFCPCGDFHRRKLPCKHIYRLAMELNIIDGNPVNDITKVKLQKYSDGYSIEEIINIVSKLPIESQQILYEHVRQYKQGIYQTAVHKNEFLQKLLDDKILYECDNLEVRLCCIGRNELNNRISAFNIPFKKNLSHIKLVEFCINTFTREQLESICSDYIAISLEDAFIKNRADMLSYLKHKFDPPTYFDGVSFRISD